MFNMILKVVYIIAFNYMKSKKTYNNIHGM